MFIFIDLYLLCYEQLANIRFKYIKTSSNGFILIPQGKYHHNCLAQFAFCTFFVGLLVFNLECFAEWL